MKADQKADRSFGNLTIYFLFSCIIGWIYEVVLAFLYGYGFVNRGFLLGPYLPIYGFGILILLLSLNGIMARDIRVGKVPVTPLLVFFLILLLTTALEYIAGFALESLFDTRWWDYSHYKYNLHGRVCLSASIRFGLGGMAFLYLLIPGFRKLVGPLSVSLRKKLAVAIIILLCLDFALTMYLASRHGFQVVEVSM